MKRVFLLTCVVFVATAFDAAQNAPKAEIFGGYSYLRADISGITSENFNGWEASVTAIGAVLPVSPPTSAAITRASPG